MHLKSMYAPSFVGWLRDSNSRLLTAPSCLFAIMMKDIFYYFVCSYGIIEVFIMSNFGGKFYPQTSLKYV